MTSMTTKQMAIAELRNATSAYCATLEDLAASRAAMATAFAHASLRLHAARGADIPRQHAIASRAVVTVKEAVIAKKEWKS